jgi:hypothetical protein
MAQQEATRLRKRTSSRHSIERDAPLKATHRQLNISIFEASQVRLKLKATSQQVNRSPQQPLRPGSLIMSSELSWLSDLVR